MVANDNEAPGRPRSYVDQFDLVCLHQAWWKEARGRLIWNDIESLPRDLGPLALAERVVLRSADEWVYGHQFEHAWVKVTEGGQWPLRTFQPNQWAEPTLDDAMLLGRE